MDLYEHKVEELDEPYLENFIPSLSIRSAIEKGRYSLSKEEDCWTIKDSRTSQEHEYNSFNEVREVLNETGRYRTVRHTNGKLEVKDREEEDAWIKSDSFLENKP